MEEESNRGNALLYLCVCCAEGSGVAMCICTPINQYKMD